MAVSGVEGFILVGGAGKSADKWNASLKQAIIDRSNFLTLGEPLNAAGQRTGDLSFEGPYEAPLNFDRGELIEVGFGISNLFNITVTLRVGEINLTNDKDSGPRFSVSGQQYGAAAVSGL